jgi:hypothetical protein
LLFPWLTSSSALKMRPVRSSEMVMNFYGTTQQHIPEEGILLYDHVCKVLRHIYGHWYIWLHTSLNRPTFQAYFPHNITYIATPQSFYFIVWTKMAVRSL